MDAIVPTGLPDLLTVAERRVAGHDLRRRVPRSAHAEWTPPSDRRDPIAILQDGDAGRIQALLPLRYGRMSTDPLAFLRGSAAVMAADLGGLPTPGLRVQAGGDAHLMNFGAFWSELGGLIEGGAVFDANDFDETLPAPFEWDLKRLATSLAVAARQAGLGDKAGRAIARRAAQAYRTHINDLAGVAPLDAWWSRIELEEAIEEIGDRDVRRAQRQRLHHAVEISRDAYRPLLTDGGRLRIKERPPAIFRLGDAEQTAHAAFASYRANLPEERRVLLERYRPRDLAFKAVGVGSVGTFCAIGLLATADGDSLLLQVKEARQSVLAPYAGASAYTHQGQRVVVGQRIMQATPDLFLGWAESGAAGAPDRREFYVRQLKDSRLAAIGADIEAGALPFYARLCGRTLARSHARSGDAARIAGYLGDGDSFDTALATFALAYADQTEADHHALREAIKVGRIEAAPPKAR